MMRLYSDLLDLIISNNLDRNLKRSTRGLAAKKYGYLGTYGYLGMCSLLWNSDGSHSFLKEKGCLIPTIFEKHVGYN